ncbi:MAG: aspartate aminotransferase family protein [Candidatus Cyclobacteriaceae bacterium M3_2C_046]
MLTNRQLFLNHLAHTTDFPLMVEIESAQGIYLFGPDGKKYIDLISGIGVSNLGHRHPQVIEAIKAQLDKYLHIMVYGEFVESPQVQLASHLSDTLPASLNNCYFVNSGSEAVEGAIKLAKRFTGKPELVSCQQAYHGSSHGSLSLSGNELFKQAYRPLLPGVSHIPFGQPAYLDQITDRTAGFIMEIIQGEAGVRIADQEYYEQVRKRCNETGTMLIIDEIQTGYGRTGKFWAFEHFNLLPDILTCAKGMGGGMPLGAFIADREVMQVLKNDPILGHITTFGGHPVSASASLATLKVIQAEKLYQQAEVKAQLFKNFLKHPKIKSIRHKGLMMAVEFESFEILKPVIDKAIQNGVITDWFLYCDNAMRIAPPLIISEAEIEEACKILINCMN